MKTLAACAGLLMLVPFQLFWTNYSEPPGRRLQDGTRTTHRPIKVGTALAAWVAAAQYGAGSRPGRPGLGIPATVEKELKPWPKDRAERLRRDAEELAKLTQTVPNEADAVAGGGLPNDFNEHLKKIEKLSKRLRSEISE